MSESSEIIQKLYEVFLRRRPTLDELASWGIRCDSLSEVASLVDTLVQSDEHQMLVGVVPGHPPGHFYSPIPDPDLIQRDRLDKTRASTTSISGIDLGLQEQRQLWTRLTALRNGLVRTKVEGRRYFYENQVYGPGDAFVLSAMLGILRPKRVIEIGSGFSSACMLDAAEDHRLETRFTFIEPNPGTLFWHLSAKDRDACSIILSPVQEVDLTTFDVLEAGDLLFIDSTHVMKSGSDVNYEFFDILPRLKPGVIVHFHDVFWPFEYPADWLIHARYAWNELYGLRAFLMYNQKFSVIFFNDAFALLCSDEVTRSPECSRELFISNPGGGLWLQVN